MFEILDEMNLDDVKNETKLVAISNTFISGEKVKKGAKISMGTDFDCLLEIMNEKYIPILIMVDKEEYFKRQKASAEKNKAIADKINDKPQ